LTAAEERSAIDRTLEGDASAFEALVLNNQKNVYNLALRMTGDENDALDVSQEAFLRAYTHLGSFKGESRFSVWLYRITYNICSDLLRKKARDKSVHIISLDEYGDGREPELPDARALPEDMLLRRELFAAVVKGLESLPPVYRETLLLRESSGLSYADIAEVTGVSEGTVKSRLSRARQALARILTENGTLGDEKRLKI
jgi:RNA polymerase sigma-70 factor (ECF subfamily)